MEAVDVRIGAESAIGSGPRMSTEPPPEPAADAAPLPRYSPFVRSKSWEPHGRWLDDRTQLRWPDTVLNPTFVRWIPRLLLGVMLLLAALTIGVLTDLRGFLVIVALTLVVLGWQEWWRTWDLTAMPLRLTAFGVQLALTAALVILNPLCAFFAFSSFMIAGTMFTGWYLLATLFLTSLTVSIGQIGGVWQLKQSLPIYLTLVAVNMMISLAFTTLSNRREEAVLNRDFAMKELIAAQQANAELQDQLLAKARDTGMLDERARLARELHDTVAQGLVAVVTQLEAINDTDVQSAGVRQRVDRAKALARQSLGEARRAVNALQPPALDDRGLPDALQGLVGDWADLNAVRAQLRTSGDARATDHDAVLVRVCQEALSNVAWHAGADRVAVTLTYLEDEVLLDIRDDGTGFDPTCTPDPDASGGHGLPGMAERLRLADGRLAVESEPGAGCVVSAAVPG